MMKTTIVNFLAGIFKKLFEEKVEGMTWRHVQTVWQKIFRYKIKDQKELFETMHGKNPLYESRKQQLEQLLQKMEDKSCHIVKISGANEMGKDIFAAHLYAKMAERGKLSPFIISPSDSKSIEECMDVIFEKKPSKRQFYKYLRKHPCFIVLQNAELLVSGGMEVVNDYDILKNKISDKRCKSRLILLYNRTAERDIDLNKDQSVKIELKGLDLETDGVYFRKKFTNSIPEDSFLKLFFDSCDGYPGVMETVGNKLGDVSSAVLKNFKRSEDFQRLYCESSSEKYRVVLDRLTGDERKLLQYLTLQSPRTEKELAGLLEKTEYELEKDLRSLKDGFYIDRQGEFVSIRNTIRHQIYYEMTQSGIRAVENHNLLDMDKYLLYEICKENGSDAMKNAEVLEAVRCELCKIYSSKSIKKTLCMMLEESSRKENAYEYAITNALNLLIYMGGNLSGLDLSGLPVGAVDFSGLELRDVDLRGADVRKARFSELLDRITCCKFHPGGRFFVTGGVDGNLIFWDNETWQKIYHIPGHKNTVWDIAFSQDGKYLASCGDDAALNLWNIEHIENDEIALLYDKQIPSPQKTWLSCLAWYGNEIMAAGGDGWIYRYDFKNKKVERLYEGRGEQYHSLRFSPDGTILLAGTRDGTLFMLRLVKSGDGWKFAKKINTNCKHISAITFLDNEAGNEFLIGGEQGTLIKWNRQETRFIRKWAVNAHEDMITGIQVADKGEVIVTGSHDGVIKIWTRDGELKETRIFQKNPSKIHRLCVRGDQILACSADASIWMLNLHSKSVGRIRGSSPWCSDIALYGNGNYLVTSCADACIRIWNLKTEKVLEIRLESQMEVTSIAVSPDEKILAAGCSDGTLYLWDIRANGKAENMTKRKVHKGAVRRMAFLSGTYRLISASSNDWKVYCHRLQWNKSKVIMPEILCESFPNWLGSVAVNLEKKILAYTSGWAKIQISKFDDEGMEHIKEIDACGNVYQTITISPDGTRLAATTDDGRLILWQIKDESNKKEQQVSAYHAGAVAFSPDGRFLAVSDSAGMLCIVDADTLCVIDSAEVSSRALLALVFDQNNFTIYASGEEGNVAVCSIEEDAEGIVTIKKEKVIRRINRYARMKIRGNDLPKIRIYSLESQGAIVEQE